MGIGRHAAALVVGGLCVLGTGCASSTPSAGPPPPTSSGSTGSNGPSTTVAPATAPPATAAPVRHQAASTVEREVSGAYRQGLSSTAGGWVFSTNQALYRTDAALVEVAKNETAIPASWAAQGYDHIGDIDIVDDVIYAPVEQDDTTRGRQAMFRYDATTLAFIDAVEIAQHHNSFVSVDPATKIAYSTDQFDDDALVRYDTTKAWVPLDPIHLDRKLGHIQGGDLAEGAFWISTDDDHDGLYRVDLATGHVEDLGSTGHADGEGEGIDATPSPTGLLHVIAIDAKLLPVRLIDFEVT